MLQLGERTGNNTHWIVFFNVTQASLWLRLAASHHLFFFLLLPHSFRGVHVSLRSVGSNVSTCLGRYHVLWRDKRELELGRITTRCWSRLEAHQTTAKLLRRSCCWRTLENAGERWRRLLLHLENAGECWRTLESTAPPGWRFYQEGRTKQGLSKAFFYSYLKLQHLVE